MSDIHECNCCNEKVYMDNAEHCVVCGSWFCPACNFKNGIGLFDEENENHYYICKDCLEEGLAIINDDNEDDAVFSEEEYNKAVKELESQNN